MPGKGHGFLHADVSGKFFAIMAENDVAELAGKAATDRIKRQILIVSDDILKIIRIDMECDGVLVFAEHGNQVVSFDSGIMRKIRKGHGKHAGCMLDDRERDNGRDVDMMEYQRTKGGGRSQGIIRFCHIIHPFR